MIGNRVVGALGIIAGAVFIGIGARAAEHSQPGPAFWLGLAGAISIISGLLLIGTARR